MGCATSKPAGEHAAALAGDAAGGSGGGARASLAVLDCPARAHVEITAL